MSSNSRTKLVVVGLGMVGIAFIEKLLKLDARAREYDVVVIGEEPHLAYNRVGLTSFFSHREVESLYLNPREWYTQHARSHALAYHINTLVTSISPPSQTLTCANGDVIPYDILVLATGSAAVLPSPQTPGHDARGVFVYRTIADLERLIAFGDAHRGTVGAVVGGGLLGLEAANAMMGLRCYERVRLVERNRWVLSRQLDAEAGRLVMEKVAGLGLEVVLEKRVARIETDAGNNVAGVVFEDGGRMACSTVCFAIGVKPRDQLARSAGIECADERGGGGGGIIVNDDLSTSIPNIYAVGECASWQNQTFGLIAPGIEMADVLSFNLTQAKLHRPRAFKRPDLSTKLKLLGVDVASFGDFFADRDGPSQLPAKKAAAAARKTASSEGEGEPQVKALVYKDPFAQVYKKYLFTRDGKRLLGGMMIGDTRDYARLVALAKSSKELDIPPAQLILGAAKKKKNKEGDDDDDGADDLDLDDDAQICSCHNVSKGDVARRVRGGACKTLGDVKACTKAGTGCGGCVPLVTSVFHHAMAELGAEVTNHLCAHFSYSRADLYSIAKVKKLKTLAEVMREAGNDGASEGCEACKPAVASILASLWNAHVMDKAVHGLQDTNDRYLGNIQRNGTFSVVPRVSAGEITPEKLIVIGEVAREYGLYTKITGGQRIDMFGARKQDLPAIWAKLVAAGMESGHAYAKSLRTVKSCVGTTWCRFGVGDSVGMAVRIEERYKSIRSPHKIKGGVSGCVRECAEARSKDFGLIATEKGFNIFVAGNGGANPKHSVLFAKDVPPAEVIPILDRYLMFYIQTADKLQRTARWLESLPGGLKYLQAVVLEDKLGICKELEAQMQALVDSFFDEWAAAVSDPKIVSKFRQFANDTPILTPVTTTAIASSNGNMDNNTDSKNNCTANDEVLVEIESQTERGQTRPVAWPKESALDNFKGLRSTWASTSWQPVLSASYFAGADDQPNGISAAIRRGDTQLAVWRVRGRYYATQQMCPHKRTFALSDGLVGLDVASPPSPTTPSSTLPPSSSTIPNTTPSPDPKSAAAAAAGEKTPYISCPYHKRNFSLARGDCRNDSSLSIATFAAEERPDGLVYLLLPPVAELDAALGTTRWKVRKEDGEADTTVETKTPRRAGRKAGVKVLGAAMNGSIEVLPAGVGGGGGCGAAPDW